MKHFEEIKIGNKAEIKHKITQIDNDAHIGNVTIHDINYHAGTFDIGYIIGDKNHWGTSASTPNLIIIL